MLKLPAVAARTAQIVAIKQIIPQHSLVLLQQMNMVTGFLATNFLICCAVHSSAAICTKRHGLAD